MTPDVLHRLRDRRFRRLPAHRVHGERDALAFVREVGFCSTFYRFPEGVACLWEAVAGKPNPRWPRLSHTARRLMDAMVEEHPQYTRQLRANVFMLEPSKTREFERAMAELQQGLWLVKSEERYEPTFSGRWDLLEAWLPDEVREGRRLSRQAAITGLIERYTRGAIFTSERQLARLFGLTSDEIARAVKPLVRARTVRPDCAVDGWPGRWLIHGAAGNTRAAERS